jgi:hypothetical protein
MGLLALDTGTTNQLIAAGAALGGAIIGGVVAFATTLLQNRQAREAREVEGASARRGRAAEILGRARVFLTDVDPARIGINVKPGHDAEAVGGPRCATQRPARRALHVRRIIRRRCRHGPNRAA